MLNSREIQNHLATNGYSWLPNYKNILQDVWAHVEVFFDDDETVLSALWASFKREEENYIGVVFITSKRFFTVECIEGQSHVKYTPLQIYNLEKIKIQFAKTSGNLNYISLVSDTFGNGTTFACPNQEVVKHFVETLRGKTNAEFEYLPDSDNPLLAENEKEQLIDSELEKAKEKMPHKFQEKVEEIAPMKDFDLWKKETPIAGEKEIEIKAVPKKVEKISKAKKEGYGSKYQSKLWLLWFLIPLILGGIILCVIFLI